MNSPVGVQSGWEWCTATNYGRDAIENSIDCASVDGEICFCTPLWWGNWHVSPEDAA